MDFTVWALKGDGTAEVVAEGVDGERAESIARHPSLSGCRVAVLPTWAAGPVPTSPAVLAAMAAERGN